MQEHLSPVESKRVGVKQVRVRQVGEWLDGKICKGEISECGIGK